MEIIWLNKKGWFLYDDGFKTNTQQVDFNSVVNVTGYFLGRD
jgi:hypothetical protein